MKTWSLMGHERVDAKRAVGSRLCGLCHLARGAFERAFECACDASDRSHARRTAPAARRRRSAASSAPDMAGLMQTTCCIICDRDPLVKGCIGKACASQPSDLVAALELVHVTDDHPDARRMACTVSEGRL